MEFESSAEDERKLKNLATRILSNGVEVLVKDKNSEGKQEQRQVKLMHNLSTMKPTQRISLSLPQQSLISSAVATVVSRQQMNAMFPLHQLMQHNYIIKTCMTTYTYLTTVIQNKRSAVSTFETTVSVVTTESLTNLFASEIADLMPTKTKYVEMKTIQPSISGATFHSSLPKIDKRIDNSEEDFDFIQPSEVGSTPCTSSCSCSQTKTEGLKTSQINAASATINYGIKNPQYGSKIESKINSQDKKTQYNPYEYENSHLAPTDRIVEKYTEVINAYSEEKESNSVEASELLTNEQAPNLPAKNKNKVTIEKTSEKPKPDKPLKVNKNKFVVADLLKLGSLGIKGLSQLAPVFEKMTGGFIRRQDINKTTSTTTSKPVTKITPYVVNKRVDSDIDYKQSNFPIYIPVDEMETSESQTVFTNATLHQNLVWAAEHKQPKAHIVPPRIVHESPLVNGGIPISPGEIIRANSDVIVGKPAVGGPLTLAASGIKLHNPVNPPLLDSIGAGTEDFIIQEKPHLNEQSLLGANIDDSYDLRPPMAPKPNQFKPNRNVPRPVGFNQNTPHKIPQRSNPVPHTSNDNVMKTEKVKSTNTVFGNHGRPAFLDYIPSLGKPNSEPPTKHHVDFRPVNEEQDDIPDNSPSSSEMFHTRVTSDGKYEVSSDSDSLNKPLLVDIQPSRVANVLIPHGSSTALVFAGSSEPHKTGDYIDDPLPYPEPGYFGSFSIDAPQLTNVHNVAPNNGKKHFAQNSKPVIEAYKPISTPFKDQSQRHDLKYKWKDSKRPIDFSIPPPTSKQETHLQVGPQITVYNPNIYNPQNNFEKYHHIKNKDKQKDAKEIIDKDYENYLAVPPPPPKMQFNHDMNNKNKPYSQRPVVHTKPVQDMKVFLNIQHPIPNSSKHEQIPTKVTSEIYYAEQKPNSKPSPTYTIHIPPSPPTYGTVHNSVPLRNNNNYNNVFNTNSGHSQNSFTVVSSPNFSNKSVVETNIDNSDNTYSVTLNTATNVASNGDSGPVIGSSMPVSIDTSNIGSINANIPIGTNFAMKVEGSPLETYNKETYDTPTLHYEEHNRKPYLEVTVGDNRWNESTNYNFKETTVLENGQNTQNLNKDLTHLNDVNPSVAPSQNSHANFPMLNNNDGSNIYENTKPVSEANNENYDENNNVKNTDQKRPGKRIPNIPTNSHGWYSNLPINENSFDSLNNIKVEGTTRKIIPLLHNYNKHSKPEFGQKVTSIGKPPTEYYAQNTPASITHHGKPFSKSPSTEKTNVLSVTNTYDSHYIPSNFGIVKQPVYDIPIRDNSDETTTAKYVKPTVDNIKPVYEDSEEIYDGKEENDSNNESEGDGISSESMKVPVVSSSSEEKIDDIKIKTNTTTKVKDQINVSSNKNNENVHPEQFYPGTQTEKPFKNKTTSFQSNAIKPIYNSNSHMRPRPFAPNSATLDNQLHQPHWQINQMMENSTNASYEENLELNMGEEMSTVKVNKPTTHKNPYHFGIPDSRYKIPVRPVFSLKLNNTHANDSIITSTIHINNKNPLIVKDIEKSTLPSFTLSNLELNRSSSEIIDLSPPPPTMDYNFKPSTNDEMIMGMSPPPPRTPPARLPARQPPTPRPIPPRSPPPLKTKPSRTLPPRLPTQRPTRKPIRDEVSTYRPAYDILNNVKRPTFNRDQPSSQLLPPPRDVASEIIKLVHDRPISAYSSPNVVFPTPISSGWLTSSGVDFTSSFDFGPTSVQFPHVYKPSEAPNHPDASSESFNDYYVDSSSERNEYESGEKPSSELSTSKENVESSSELISKVTTSSKENVSDLAANESSQEDTSTERNRVNVLGNKNRTRKPYPTRNNEKKTNTNKYKLPSRPVNVIKPTSVLTRPDLLNPTRHVSIKKIVRPLPSRHVELASIIESSESPIKEDFIKPTEVLKENITPTIKPETVLPIVEKVPAIHVQDSEVIESSIRPIHHAGNEVKIVDEILPTKTEFRTTVVTLTKTLSEPPKTVSSIGYVNLTHTLTVTHTKTSLISQSEGAVTQTLVLTNTQTSTIVDVITEIHTQVQPTTIIETVTKHIQIPNVEPTPVIIVTPTSKVKLDDLTMSSEEDNLIIREDETTENVQKISTEGNDNAEGDNDTFFVVMNKSQGGGSVPPISTDIDTGDYDGITRNEQVNNNGVSQVLFGEILLAGTPYLETNVVNPTVLGKECQPDCKASRNERCQRIDGLMKCVCRPGFARMFPDRPCKPTYTYSVRLALSSQANEKLVYHDQLADNSSKPYQALALAAHEGINRMVMQSDLRDVFHGVHITGFHPVEMRKNGEPYNGVMNDFYVQLSDNAHESRLKEVIEKYLRNNNYSLGGTDVHASGELMEKLEVNDFDECLSGQFHDCSEHAQCFNLRGTYTCSCVEGFADLSVNTLYPGRICSAEPVGCERCNYHGTCYSRDDRRVLCECFQWYAGSSCHINLKVVLISLVVCGALLTLVLAACAVIACSRRPRPPPRSIVTCIQGMPTLHQGAMPSKQRADRRALISERGESGDASSVQNASLPYMPTKRLSSNSKKCQVICDPPAHEAPPPPPAPAVMIPRARLHPHHTDSRENICRKKSMELSNEDKLISYLESGAAINNDEMRRKHSMESSYSANTNRHNKQGALVSAGFKVSTTVRPDESTMQDDRDDLSSLNKADMEAELARFNTLRKSYSQDELSEWTDAERRIGELTLSEARSVGGTLPASTGRAASSTRLTHQEANTMAERDLGSTFLLPHVHLYKPDLTSDVSEFDSL